LQFECDDNNNLSNLKSLSKKINTTQGIQFASALQAVVETSVSKRCETGSRSKKPDAIALYNEFDSYVANRSSNNYDKLKIQEIIDLAIKNKVDPYAAISIAIMENPPLKGNRYSDSNIYEMFYGPLPVDDLAGIDLFGCKLARNVNELGSNKKISEEDVIHFKQLKTEIKHKEDTHDPIYPEEISELRKNQPEKYDQLDCFSRKPFCIGYVIPKNRGLTEFNISRNSDGSDNKTVYACRGDERTFAGSNLSFDFVDRNDPSKCCAKIQVDKKDIASGIAARLLKTVIGLEYMKKKIQSSYKHLKSETDKSKMLSLLFQRYNGLGKINVTEKMTKNCLSGMDMSKTPVYGTESSDIMLNMLMSNNEISNMVESALKKYSEKPKSILCITYGSGIHILETKEVVELQKKYLTNQSSCLNIKSPPTFKPWTSLDEATKSGK
jgi:hypothetical protein